MTLKDWGIEIIGPITIPGEGADPALFPKDVQTAIEWATANRIEQEKANG